MARALMATFDDVVLFCANLPGVTLATSYATPALKVKGMSFCRLWGPRDASKADVGDAEVLVVFCELDEKEFLLADSDGSVFTAPHYDGHGSVLVRLHDVEEKLLESLLIESYLLRAPATLRNQFLGN